VAQGGQCDALIRCAMRYAARCTNRGGDGVGFAQSHCALGLRQVDEHGLSQHRATPFEQGDRETLSRLWL